MLIIWLYCFCSWKYSIQFHANSYGLAEAKISVSKNQNFKKLQLKQALSFFPEFSDMFSPLAMTALVRAGLFKFVLFCWYK